MTMPTDPSPVERGARLKEWYREQAEESGEITSEAMFHVRLYGTASEARVAYRHARIAAHFGHLALADRSEGVEALIEKWRSESGDDDSTVAMLLRERPDLPTPVFNAVRERARIRRKCADELAASLGKERSDG